MAPVIWRCPSCGDKPYQERGMCHVHVRPLVPHEIDAQDIEAQDVESQDEPEATAAGVRMALLFAGGRLDVPPDGLVVGRSSDACRRLPDMRTLDQISRHEHARFYWEDDVLYVVDCGSTNGTYVAGVPAVRPIPVSPGAALRFAKDVPVEVVALDEFGMLSRED